MLISKVLFDTKTVLLNLLTSDFFLVLQEVKNMASNKPYVIFGANTTTHLAVSMLNRAPLVLQKLIRATHGEMM